MSLNYLDFEGITKNERGEFDGIDVLVQMARQGKIDPWAIDIVEVADMFSAHLFQSKAQNLRYTSRVILYAAILLKMKSDILDGVDIMEILPQDDSFEPDVDLPPEWDEEPVVPTNNVASFDEVLQRRTSVRLNRNRVVTLRDLVRQLEFYAKLDKKFEIEQAKKRAQNAHIRRRNDISKLTTEDMVNLAHDEDYKLGASILKTNLQEILNRQDKIELNELTLLGMDKVTAFISLLFLVQEGDYTIEQQNFYGDLFVVKNQHKEEETEETEDVINVIMARDALSDDVADIVDNVVSISRNIETEEITK